MSDVVYTSRVRIERIKGPLPRPCLAFTLKWSN